MNRYLAVPRVLLMLALTPLAANAQEVPARAQMDLWCGTAFDLMTRDAPPDNDAGKLASALPFVEGAKLLIDRAIPIYLEAGYSDRALADFRSRLEDSIRRVVNGSKRAQEEATYSFQDCAALIGQ